MRQEMQTGRHLAQFGLRMPDEVKAWVKRKAFEEGRSVNSQIVHLLRREKAAEEGASAE